MHPAELIHRIQKGLRFSELKTLQHSLDMPFEQLAAKLSISRSTLQRRKHAGRLSPDESNKVVRFSRLLRQAADLFGNVEKARAWLAGIQERDPLIPLGWAQQARQGHGKAVLAQQVELREFAPRQRIYKAGEQSKSGFVVLTGAVRVTLIDEDGQEVLFSEPQHGDFFGSVRSEAGRAVPGADGGGI